MKRSFVQQAWKTTDGMDFCGLEKLATMVRAHNPRVLHKPTEVEFEFFDTLNVKEPTTVTMIVRDEAHHSTSSALKNF